MSIGYWLLYFVLYSFWFSILNKLGNVFCLEMPRPISTHFRFFQNMLDVWLIHPMTFHLISNRLQNLMVGRQQTIKQIKRPCIVGNVFLSNTSALLKSSNGLILLSRYKAQTSKSSTVFAKSFKTSVFVKRISFLESTPCIKAVRKCKVSPSRDSKCI